MFFRSLHLLFYMFEFIYFQGRTKLCWYAQDEVILKALEPLVYLKEEELIEPLISMLMTLLKNKYPQVLNVELLVSPYRYETFLLIH